MSDCTVYIDESGDLGVNRGTQWFVMTAVIVDKTEETNIRAALNRIRARLNIQEIHIKNITDYFKRAFIVHELSGESFVYMNVLVDTTKFDTAKIPSSLIAYNYVCKYLLQRVSACLEANGKTADIVLSARGTSRDADLIKYIQDKLFPYPANRINASLFGSVSAKAASAWDMLQLADVCATTMFLTYEINHYGFCVPCFSIALRDHLFQRNNRIEPYGIKFFQSSMKPDVEQLRKKRICVQKERTPGATAT